MTAVRVVESADAPGSPDSSAVSYDRWFDTPWGRFAFGIERRALDRASPAAGFARVLDAGCGTGRFTEHLANRFRAVVGLDLDPDMLAMAAERVRARLVEGDAVALPFGDGRFDLAVAVTVCEFTADPAAVIAELARVVRPGGRVVVGSLNPRSLWGLARRGRLRQAPWTSAQFLTRGRLRQLGRRHGSVEIDASLYAPWPVSIAWVIEVLEAAGRRLAPALGAFQVLVIDKGNELSESEGRRGR